MLTMRVELVIKSLFLCISTNSILLKNLIGYSKYDESAAGSVIKATVMVEFEDGLRTGVLHGGY